MTETFAIAACVIAASKCGRYWKAAVRRAWESGQYAREGLDDIASELQQTRNAFGPSWLHRLRLPRAA